MKKRNETGTENPPVSDVIPEKEKNSGKRKEQAEKRTRGKSKKKNRKIFPVLFQSVEIFSDLFVFAVDNFNDRTVDLFFTVDEDCFPVSEDLRVELEDQCVADQLKHKEVRHQKVDPSDEGERGQVEDRCDPSEDCRDNVGDRDSDNGPVDIIEDNARDEIGRASCRERVSPRV